jgi:hypothetical protein
MPNNILMRKEKRDATAKSKAQPKPNEASAQAKAVIESLTEIIRTLAFVGYQSTEDSGDYRHAGNGGRRGIYKQYWEDQYQFIFFSAFYTLNEDLRRNPSIHKTAKNSLKLYNEFLSDKQACEQAYREHKGSSKRISEIRVYDGAKFKKPVQKASANYSKSDNISYEKR